MIFSTAPYPARTIEPVASALAVELSKYSWWGGTALHLHEAEEHKIHLQSLILGIKLELKSIEERKALLAEEKQNMEAAKQLYLDMQEQLCTAQEAEHILKEDVQELWGHTVISGGLKYQSKMSQYGFFAGDKSVSAPTGFKILRRHPTPLFSQERLPLDDSSDDDISDHDDNEQQGGKKDAEIEKGERDDHLV